MIFEEYQTVIYIAISIQIVALLLWRAYPILATYALLMSLLAKGQFVWLGFPFYSWHMVAITSSIFLVSALTVPTRTEKPLSRLSAAQSLFSGFIIYQLAVSIAVWSALVIDAKFDPSTQPQGSRILTQLMYFSLILGLFSFGWRLGRKVQPAVMIYAIFNVSFIFALFSFVQLAVFYAFGLNIFPIIRADGSAETAFILDYFFRASSFAGEPKHLGISSAIGAAAWLAMIIGKIPIKRFHSIKIVFIVSSIFVSLSATGFAIMGATIVVLFVFFPYKLNRSIVVTFIFGIALLIATIINLNDDYLAISVNQFFKFRFEVQDVSVLYALMDQPLLWVTGSGLGNIHIFSVHFLPIEFQLFREGGYKANSGLFYIIGDGGVLSFFLLMGAGVYTVRNLKFQEMRVRSGSKRREIFSLRFFLCVAMLAFSVRYSEILFLLLGFCFGYLSIPSRASDLQSYFATDRRNEVDRK